MGTNESSIRERAFSSALFASALVFWLWPKGSLLGDAYLRTPTWIEVLLVVGVIGLFLASIRVFFNFRFGCALGLAGASALLIARAFWEFDDYRRSNSWIAFNIPEANLRYAIAAQCLIVVLLFVAAFAASRLAPQGWSLRGTAVRQSILLPVAVVGALTGVWYLTAVWPPYRMPVADYRNYYPYDDVFILKVERDGWRFRESSVGATRDGRLYRSSSTRHLFEFEFDDDRSQVPLLVHFSELERMFSSPELTSRGGMDYHGLPRKWRYEMWYVRSNYPESYVVVTTDPSDLPAELVTWFEQMHKVRAPKRTLNRRDICFGFCYDPLW